MRLCVALALISILASPTALAAKKKPKKAKVVKTGPSLDASGDPARTERSDEGPFAPKGATGPLQPKPKPAAPKPPKPRPRDETLAFADVLLASGRTPLPAPSGRAESRDAKLVALIVGLQHDVSAKLTLGLRVPGTAASIERATLTGTESAFALGNPELFGEYRVKLSPVVALPVAFGLGVPVAQGDPDPSTTDAGAARSATVNALADAAHGYREGELYWPKRLPVVFGLGVRRETTTLTVHAATKLIAGFNIASALDNDRVFGGVGRLDQNPVALRSVTGAGLAYQLLDEPALGAGLDAWFVYNPIVPIEFESEARPPTPFQFVVEPRLFANLGKLRPSLGLVLPIGGRLHNADMLAVRVHLDYAF